jgi:acetyl esterase/lipase
MVVSSNENEHRDNDNRNIAAEAASLVTPASLRMSLSAPRAPPHGTLHRSVLNRLKKRSLIRRRGSDCYVDLLPHDDIIEHEPHTHDSNEILDDQDLRLLQSKFKLQRLIPDLHLRQSMHNMLPHPHLPDALTGADALSRWIGLHLLSLSRQNEWRDQGVFRSISDTLVTVSAPMVAFMEPKAIRTFLRLSSSRRLTKFQYGSHHMQQTHFLGPTPPELRKKNNSRNNSTSTSQIKGLVVFVHGGAWGSGQPWMYRLAARPFLELGLAVAIAGYRTYPDADVQGQLDDVRSAIQDLQIRPETRHCFAHARNNKHDSCHNTNSNSLYLVGHSSGAHIALLMLIQNLQRDLMKEVKQNDAATSTSLPPPSPLFDAFIGLSGPYDISHHFDFEAARGVEELSPMKPACGYSRDNFDKSSPALSLKRGLKAVNNESRVASLLPPSILLVHGMEDSTVPFTATSEAASILRSCGVSQVDEIYLAQIQHQETVMHLMLGGITCDETLKWMLLRKKRSTIIRSKL